MVNIFLTAFLTGFTGAITLIFFFGVCFYAGKRWLSGQFVKHFTSSSEGSASNFALLCQSIASIFGSEISQRLKSTFLGVESVAAKKESREAAMNLSSGNPVLGAIMASFPSVAKRIIKNPAMGAMISSFLTPKGRIGSMQEKTDGHDESIQFHF